MLNICFKNISKLIYILIFITYSNSVFSQLSNEIKKQIKVISCNIFNGGNKEGFNDLNNALKVIQNNDPDIIALQKVDSGSTDSQSRNMIEELGKLTHMSLINSENGVVVLTKFQILESLNHRLPCINESEQRFALELILRRNEKDTIRFVCAYSSHNSKSLSVSQARFINNLFNDNIPTILAGDFTVDRQSKEMDVLNEKWTESVGSDLKATLPACSQSSVDYVLFKPKYRWNSTDSSVVNDVKYSDHSQVIATFELKDNERIDWKTKEIARGVKWYSFLGYIDMFMSYQSINVIEVDLNKTEKKLRLAQSYENPSGITVDSMAISFNAIAAINGTYTDNEKANGTEKHISYYKSNDIEYEDISFPYDHPLSWKNDGCFYITKNEKAGIIRGEKELYENLDAPHIISGSPILIENNIPVGKYFVPYKISKLMSSSDCVSLLDYENPYRHQGVRHPRTAIGLKDENTVLLVTVDGRDKQAEGMSASELTTLLYDCLGCKDALNLDGGGSTTMWIKGETENGVVNYPSGGNGIKEKTLSHNVLRKLTNAIVIVP